MKRRLSIITISLNNTALAKTLDSVKKQNLGPQNFEHIIIEGNPKSKNCKLLSNYQTSVKYKVKYLCEKDGGIYSAMNKGINLCSGQYLLFLNSGDLLANSSILKKVFSQEHHNDILYGEIKSPNHIKSNKPQKLKNKKINFDFFILNNLHHQASFIKKDLFKEMGDYNENYKIVGDFEFWLRCFSHKKMTLTYLPFDISIYDPQGISSVRINRVYKERSLAISKYTNGGSKFYHLLKYAYYQFKDTFDPAR